MRVICAPDKFKQCCTAAEAARAMAQGVRAALPSAQVTELPLADGGEGTLDVLAGAFPQRRTARVRDALGREVEAAFALSADGRRALVESAQACGLWRIEEPDRDPLRASTFGVGQLVAAALDAGAGELLVGLGGSATSDGGMGMAAALGARFADSNGNQLAPSGGNLHQVRSIDLSTIDARLKRTRVRALCDIMSPMLGERGASRSYVVQKGGTTRTMHKLEEGLAFLSANVVKAGVRVTGLEDGTGAAGGLGFGVKAFLGGELEAGADAVLKTLDFRRLAAACELVLTGEGSFDPQTGDGKLVAALAVEARAAGVPLVVLAGVVQPGVELPGVTAAFGISPYGARKQDCFDAAPANLARLAASVVRLLNSRK
ncbi:MAG: glycerate kinase [Planctomycetes bacterium]|nr:glycerate kinase [Planctomycetota bacterium]